MTSTKTSKTFKTDNGLRIELWENYGKRRAYVYDLVTTGKQPVEKSFGYIDLVTGEVSERIVSIRLFKSDVTLEQVLAFFNN